MQIGKVPRLYFANESMASGRASKAAFNEAEVKVIQSKPPDKFGRELLKAVGANTELALRLIEHSTPAQKQAIFTTRNECGQTVLHLAAGRSQQAELVFKLIDTVPMDYDFIHVKKNDGRIALESSWYDETCPGWNGGTFQALIQRGSYGCTSFIWEIEQDDDFSEITVHRLRIAATLGRIAKILIPNAINLPNDESVKKLLLIAEKARNDFNRVSGNSCEEKFRNAVSHDCTYKEGLISRLLSAFQTTEQKNTDSIRVLTDAMEDAGVVFIDPSKKTINFVLEELAR